MEAIILAGGLGTRLRSIVSDIPKPMAPIKGRPFLEYIMEYLWKQGVTRVVLSTGYKHDVIESYFGCFYKGISIKYSVEKEPLGTGGGIKKALENVQNENVFIVNGDTFFHVNLFDLMKYHIGSKTALTIALKPMQNFDRYGAVIVNGGKITQFKEKGFFESGLINGGVYVANSELFNKIRTPDKFSFENEFIEKHLGTIEISAYISDTYFIDIGIPEDYKRAQVEMGVWI